MMLMLPLINYSEILKSFLICPTSGRCGLILTKNKQAIQVIFSQKKNAVIHQTVLFNGSEVAVKKEHKHLGMILDSKLNFQSHIREEIIKAMRGIRMIGFLSKYVS